VATQNMQLQGVVLKIDPQGRCQEIRRVQLPLKSA
jgi:calcineurin-like phosphoesterase